jgi:large subunit ribosomal protein L7/L12
MAFGRNNDSADDDLKAEREREKIEAKEKKLAEREAKVQQRSEDQKVREDQKIAQAKRELESYGRKVIEEACAGKLVRIYEKGYVRVSGVFLKDGAVFEKLIAIESSADVAKKTALGRTLMFGATMGLNVLTTPNKRGDMYLTIATDRTTHMIHMSPPTERELKAMHKIATSGQGVLDSIERQSSSSPAANSPSSATQPVRNTSQSSVIDELTKLVALRDAGALSEDEFSAMKAELLGGNGAVSAAGVSIDTSESSSDQDYFDVELLDVGRRPIEAIVVVRRFTNLGLADAKRIVDSAPSILGTSLSRETATQFVEELRAIGSAAELR